MLLRSEVAIAVLALSVSGCPGSLSQSELDAFEGSARGDTNQGGNPDADRDAAMGFSCPVIPTLFRATCGGAGCHGQAAPAGGLDLTSAGYAARLMDKESSSASCSGDKLIDLAAPERSLIYTQLAPKPECGLAMPLGKPALTMEQRACVLAWIEAGAKDDEASVDAIDAGGAASPTPGTGDAGTSLPPGDVAVGTELSRAGWLATASRTGSQVDVSGAQTALDNDLTTRWGTGVTQDGTTDWFQVDMNAAKKFSVIELRMGMWDQDHPRNYKVYASNDLNNFGTPIASGTTPDEKQQVVTISFPVQTARYLRIENTGVDVNNWWSIYELFVKR